MYVAGYCLDGRTSEELVWMMIDRALLKDLIKGFSTGSIFQRLVNLVRMVSFEDIQSFRCKHSLPTTLHHLPLSESHDSQSFSIIIKPAKHRFHIIVCAQEEIIIHVRAENCSNALQKLCIFRSPSPSEHSPAHHCLSL
jgi:hypothetical protein